MKRVRMPRIVDRTAEPITFDEPLEHAQVAALYTFRNPDKPPMSRAMAEWTHRQAMKKLRESKTLLSLLEAMK